MDDTTLARIEEQRVSLENNIARLRKSLRHWQTLEIDYEGLKEEFLGLPETASPEQCLQAANDFKPELVDDKELKDLVDDGKTVPRRPSQLVDLLTKRNDYVTRNIETIRKQLSDAEKKRNALLLAERPEYQDDAGLPLREITEELDEDGNVISSSVQAPGADSNELVDVLRKAGVTDLPKANQRDPDTKDAEDIGIISTAADDPLPPRAIDPEEGSKALATDDHDDLSEGSVEDEIHRSELVQHEAAGDTDEEAALRREMLEYGLGEVGNIVAELEIEDMNSITTYDDDDDNLDDYSDEDEDLYSDDSEDERGMTKRPVISDRYRKKMEALEQRLGITNMRNAGPDAEVANGVNAQLPIRPSAAEAARKAAIDRYNANKSSTKAVDKSEKTSGEKKRVAFSDELDIAPDPKKPALSTEPDINPVGENVIERRTGDSVIKPVAPTPSAPSAPSKKVSRFKSARREAPQESLLPPPLNVSSHLPKDTSSTLGSKDQIIASTLFERETDPHTSAPDSLDFDEELHKREIAADYQRIRNAKIHEQGGYVRGGEQENYGDEYAAPAVEDSVTGKPRKLSRFKATRVRE